MDSKIKEEIIELMGEKKEELIKEYSTVLEGKLVKTLGGKILDIVKPFTASREDYLNDELSRTKVILTEINKTWLGWLVLKRVEKKLSKLARGEQ